MNWQHVQFELQAISTKELSYKSNLFAEVHSKRFIINSIGLLSMH
jgi:hypothetical protein